MFWFSNISLLIIYFVYKKIDNSKNKKCKRHEYGSNVCFGVMNMRSLRGTIQAKFVEAISQIACGSETHLSLRFLSAPKQHTQKRISRVCFT